MTKNKLIKRPEGRPTKYIPEINNPIIEDYISGCGREQTSLPTVEGLASTLGITSETIREWAKEYPEFSVTIKKLADKQKEQLMNDGMYGGKEVNAAMAIFLLKCNHGMNDGSQTNIQVTGEKVLVIPGEIANKYGSA